jgi:hypothetical protein
MLVIAEKAWDWFLFEDEGRLYLDVLVEHGAISFSVTAELTKEQSVAYAREGSNCLAGLSSDMRHKALMRQWTSTTLPPDWGRRSLAAVREWQERHKRA